MDKYKEFENISIDDFKGLFYQTDINDLKKMNITNLAEIFKLYDNQSLMSKNLPSGLIVIKFLCDLAKICGYKLELGGCNNCGNQLDEVYLNLDDFTFCCSDCKPYNCQEFDKAAYKLLDIVESTDYDRLSSLKINGLTITIASTFIKKYIEKNLMISLLKMWKNFYHISTENSGILLAIFLCLLYYIFSFWIKEKKI